MMAQINTKKSWRIIFSAILIIAGSIFAAPKVSSQTLGIAAVVNDDVISLYDLEARVHLLLVTSNQKATPELRTRLSRQVLNRLIDEKLKMQEAKRLGVRVAKRELDNAFADMEKRNKLPKGGLIDFLRSNGVDHLVLLDQIEASLAWGSAVNRTFRSQITVSEEEIDEVIAEIQAGKGKPEYLASEIFLPINNPNQANEVLNNANRLMDLLQKGASFVALARNYSQSATAAIGGDLGWVRHGQLAKEVNTALIQLKKGMASTPVRSVAGYHIILKRNERTGQGIPPSKEKIDLRQVFLPLPASASAADRAALDTRARTMGATANNCAGMEKLEKESGSPMSGSLGVVETSALPPAVQAAVKDLPVGKASVPIASNGGIIFLMVCSRTGSSAVDALRPKIRQRLMNERLDISARGYLRDLRHAAFVDLRI